MQNINPKNAVDALRLAKRVESAQEIRDAGYTFWPDRDADMIAVCKPGRLAAEYFISSGKCSCPDFAKHGDFCKHTLAFAAQEDEDHWADEQAAADAEFRQYSPLPACCPF